MYKICVTVYTVELLSTKKSHFWTGEPVTSQIVELAVLDLPPHASPTLAGHLCPLVAECRKRQLSHGSFTSILCFALFFFWVVFSLCVVCMFNLTSVLSDCMTY